LIKTVLSINYRKYFQKDNNEINGVGKQQGEEDVDKRYAA